LTKPKADLLQGTLDMLILKALSLGPLHGYGIIQRLRQLSDELLEVEQGSLYPAVYRIEQRGWISSKWGVTETGSKAKFYALTKPGSKQLTALAIAKVRKAV
jgi:PadR family transcriptional regulator, regulatory protein PadR